MTPKEKAIELVHKYWNEVTYKDEEYEPNSQAIDGALICVNELLSSMGSDRGYSWWVEVKQEIEKL